MVGINRLKNRAAETMEPTSTVINECISGLSEAAKVILFCQLQVSHCNGLC